MKKPIAYLPAIRGDEWDPFVIQVGQLISDGVAQGDKSMHLPITLKPDDAQPLGLLIVVWAENHWTLAFELTSERYQDLYREEVAMLNQLGWHEDHPAESHVWLWISKQKTSSPEACARYIVESLKALGVAPRKDWQTERAGFNSLA